MSKNVYRQKKKVPMQLATEEWNQWNITPLCTNKMQTLTTKIATSILSIKPGPFLISIIRLVTRRSMIVERNI